MPPEALSVEGQRPIVANFVRQLMAARSGPRNAYQIRAEGPAAATPHGSSQFYRSGRPALGA
eukprot:12100595-Alexandrium_andersonii.AAC.1